MKNSLQVNFLFCFCCLLLITDEVLSQDRGNYGLVFESDAHSQFERTSWSLTESGELGFFDTLEFDISIHGLVTFGYIFRSKTLNGNRIDFLYTPEGGSQLKVVIDGNQTPLNFPLSGTYLNRNEWSHIQFSFQSDNIVVCFNGRCERTVLPTSFQGFEHLIFGTNRQQELTTVDTPPFAIKEVVVKNGKELMHHWPLEYESGLAATDIIGGLDAKIINPIWLSDRSMSWQKLRTIESNLSLSILHNPSNQFIYWIQQNKIIAYDFANNMVTDYPIATAPHNFRYGIHDPINNQLVTFDIEPSSTLTFTKEGGSWVSEGEPKENPVQNLWLTTPLINPLNGELMLLGGYGFFTLKNELRTYKQGEKRWVDVPIKGDFTPRYHHAIGPGLEEGQFYVFGGIGSETGKQELGLRNYYDLFLLDMGDSSIQKVWELPISSDHFVPVNGLVSDFSDSSIYALAYNNFDSANNLSLYKFHMARPEFEKVGNEIPFLLKGFDLSQAGLFYNEKSHELIAYTSSGDDLSSQLNIYSLLFPPRNALVVLSSEPQFSKVYVFIVVVIFTLIAMFLYNKRKRVQKNILITKAKRSDKNAIYLWGGFAIFDGAGKDLSSLFSPKIKELFLLILLHSGEEEKGIDTQRIQELIWPGHDKANAKNAKGVTMGRLRGALEGMSIEIKAESGKWKVLKDEGIYFDYFDALQVMSGLSERFTAYGLERLLLILKRGSFLPGIEVSWLDEYKGKLNHQVTSCLMNTIPFVDDLEQKVVIADAVLQVDDLHEHAVKEKIIVLVALGKHGLAKEQHEKFANRFKDLYQEDFKRSFKEMSLKS